MMLFGHHTRIMSYNGFQDCVKISKYHYTGMPTNITFSNHQIILGQDNFQTLHHLLLVICPPFPKKNTYQKWFY